MKTNPKILTLVLTLTALPVVAFADPTTGKTAQAFTTMTTPVVATTVPQTTTTTEPVRFNLVDGEPIR